MTPFEVVRQRLDELEARHARVVVMAPDTERGWYAAWQVLEGVDEEISKADKGLVAALERYERHERYMPKAAGRQR